MRGSCFLVPMKGDNLPCLELAPGKRRHLIVYGEIKPRDIPKLLDHVGVLPDAVYAYMSDEVVAYGFREEYTIAKDPGAPVAKGKYKGLTWELFEFESGECNVCPLSRSFSYKSPSKEPCYLPVSIYSTVAPSMRRKSVKLADIKGDITNSKTHSALKAEVASWLKVVEELSKKGYRLKVVCYSEGEGEEE